MTPLQAENSPLNILIVEDSEADTLLLKSNLGEIGDEIHQVWATDTLAGAISLLASQEVDVILLDLTLPDSTGIATVMQVRAADPHVVIVVLTGMADERTGILSVRAGAQDFLHKAEIDSDILKRALRYAVERQRLITELEQARELANYQAMHDVLTGLPNRALFFDRLEQVIRSSDRQHQTFGLAFLDFDDFKGVNDDYGHAIGDLLLIEASHRLRSAVRRSDTVARLGGDEFTIIFERLPDRETAEVLIEGLCDRLATPFHLNGQSLDIKVSIGLAVFPEDGGDAQTLLHAADSKMYRSKRRGKLELQVIAGQTD